MSIPNDREVAEILTLLDELVQYASKLENWDEDEARNIIQTIREYLGA